MGLSAGPPAHAESTSLEGFPIWFSVLWCAKIPMSQLPRDLQVPTRDLVEGCGCTYYTVSTYNSVNIIIGSIEIYK